MECGILHHLCPAITGSKSIRTLRAVKKKVDCRLISGSEVSLTETRDMARVLF